MKKLLKPAIGLKGTLCKSYEGDYFIRVNENGQPKDYWLLHWDLDISIEDTTAWLYQKEDGQLVLDYDPGTLGYEEFMEPTDGE